MSDEALERFVTGVPGLDTILRGGLARCGVYLVQGPAGAGKTILANQIAFHHARRGATTLYVTLLAETHARMVLHMRGMSFFDAALMPEHVRYLSALKPLADEGLPGLLTLLRRTMVELDPTLLVIDGLVSAEEAAQSQLAPDEHEGSSRRREVLGVRRFKQFVNELQTIAGMTGCTVLMLSSLERPLPYAPAYTLVDGILDLSFDSQDLRPVRHVQVTKIRGIAQEIGRHVYTIDEAGVRVYPRFETRVPDMHELAPETLAATQRIAFGVPGLDQLIAEGLPAGSMTMLLGPTGSGKTLLGLRFLAEGLRQGDRCLYFGFHERPSALLATAARIGIDVQDDVESGALALVWQPLTENVVDVLVRRLFDELHRTGARRLFIDSLQGLRHALDDFPERSGRVLAAISDELQRLGITTLYSLEMTELYGERVEVPAGGVSQATQNLILMRPVESETGSDIGISVVKLRAGAHSRELRRLEIGREGLVVRPLPTPHAGIPTTPSPPANARARRRGSPR